MATKKSETVLRGAALMKKAIETAKSTGKIAEPEPVPANVLKKLKLPNEEKLSPGLKELLAFDASFLGWSIDEEDPELEPMALDELVEQEFGEEFVSRFGEPWNYWGMTASWSARAATRVTSCTLAFPTTRASIR